MIRTLSIAMVCVAAKTVIGGVATVSILAVTDQEEPVTNVDAYLSFEQGDNPDDRIRVDGRTDTNGLFSASASTSGHVAGRLMKQGWYKSDTEFKFVGSGPWSTTNRVVMRRVANPVPMYARRVCAKRLPSFNTAIGFDMMTGDWCWPHGTGTATDCVFSVYRDARDDRTSDVKVVLHFPGRGCGIVEAPDTGRTSECTLRVPNIAPADGYRPSWTNEFGWTSGRRTHGQSGRNWINFYFRTREKVTNGGSVEWTYGKMYGEVSVAGYLTATGRLNFVYYLNPDRTRNVEFDPKRNLFERLPRIEDVSAP